MNEAEQGRAAGQPYSTTEPKRKISEGGATHGPVRRGTEEGHEQNPGAFLTLINEIDLVYHRGRRDLNGRSQHSV